LIDKLCCVLGGRISEEHFFKSITTGASDDLRKAYQYANAIVTKFGMSDAIGNVGY
jgi:AFG3 family protein